MNARHASTLKGTFLTHIARGEVQVSVHTAVKTAQTYLRKTYVSASDLRAILDDVHVIGVEEFGAWAGYHERQRRFEALTEALSVVFAENSA